MKLDVLNNRFPLLTAINHNFSFLEFVCIDNFVEFILVGIKHRIPTFPTVNVARDKILFPQPLVCRFLSLGFLFAFYSNCLHGYLFIFILKFAINKQGIDRFMFV